MIKSSCENTVVKQLTGLKRNIIDKYYTREDVVEECFDLITKHVSIEEGDVCIEPSAGNGSFIKYIKSNFDNYKFYDIEPEHSEIEELDYLSFTQESIADKYNKIHVIGNPPFGRQSSLAIKFIKKSCEFCDSISFILPRSFKKNSLKKTYTVVLSFGVRTRYSY